MTAIRLPDAPRKYEQSDQDNVRRLLERALLKPGALGGGGGGGAGTLAIRLSGAPFATLIDTINFGASDFDVSETPSGTLNLSLDASVARVGHTHVKADISDFAHVHAAGDITSGTLAYARLPTGGGTWANGGALTLTGGALIVGTDPGAGLTDPSIIELLRVGGGIVAGNNISIYNTTDAELVVESWAQNPSIHFNRRRPASAAVQSGDYIGGLAGFGHDGTNFSQHSFFGMVVDGAVSLGVVPMGLEFWTGSSSMALRGFIKSDGSWIIGPADPGGTEILRIATAGDTAVRVQNTVTGKEFTFGVDTANNEGYIKNLTNHVRIEAAGDIRIDAGGSQHLTLKGAGPLEFNTGIDIGYLLFGNRPANIYVGTSVVIATDPGGSEALRVGGAARISDLILMTAASKVIPGATSLSLRNNADTASNLILTDAGLATFRNDVTLNNAGAVSPGVKFTSTTNSWQIDNSSGVMRFYLNPGSVYVTLATTALAPQTASGLTLGTASKPWGSAWFGTTTATSVVTPLVVNPGTLTIKTDAANPIDFQTNGANTRWSVLDTGILVSTDAVHQFQMRDPDIAHGMTSIIPTDTYGQIMTASGTDGGVSLNGYTEVTVAAMVIGNQTTESNTRSTAARAPIELQAWTKSGTTSAAPGADTNLVAIRSGSTTRFIFDSDGDSHQDVGTAWTNFDDHDDVALLTQLSVQVSRKSDPIRDNFRFFLEENRERLETLRLVTFDDDGHHFVNMSKLAMLLVGAVRQLGQRLETVERQLLPAL